MTATLTQIKFTIGRSVLLENLKYHRNVPNNPVVPICENIKIVIENNEAKLTTSDLKQVIETAISLPHISESAEMCLPYTPLLRLLEALPEQSLELKYSPDVYRLKIKADSGTYEFTGENPTDFPKPFEAAKKEDWFSLNSDVLRLSLESTLYAASKDEIKAAWCGVFVESGNGLSLTALDGNNLRHTSVEDRDCKVEKSDIIHSSALSTLLNILPKDTTVHLFSSHRFVWLECEAFLFSCVKVDERFPEYQNAVPKDGYRVEINRSEWLSVLKRLSLFVTKSDLIAIEINLKSVSFEVKNEDYGKNCREKLDLDSEAPEILRIGAPLARLRDALSHFGGNMVTLEYSTYNRPLVFRQENNYALVMPMMLL